MPNYLHRALIMTIIVIRHTTKGQHMSKMISARIPDGLYEQGSLQLAKLGATPSDLVKAAFEYLLHEQSLPQKAEDASRDRRLSKEKARALKEAFQACSLGISIPDDVAYAKNIARESKVSHHEALA